MKIKTLILLGAAVGPLLAALTSFAQGTTAFTYQGQLRDGGTNANGVYAMTFRLYTASSGGSLVGDPLTSSPYLANGLFTVNLDFGAGAFSGNARWLEIDVAGDTLVPRVQVLTSPYAQFATVAASVPAGTIVNASLAPNAVATANIQDSAVTATKLANGAVTDAKIDSVSGGKIVGDLSTINNVWADGSVTARGNVRGLDIIASRNLDADGTISAGGGISATANIHAGGSIHTDSFIFAADHIATRGLMSADGGFSTKDLIYAGGSIAAAGQLSTSDGLSVAKDISAGGTILAGGIVSSNNVHAYGSIHADSSVFAGGGVSTSNNIHADGSIDAGSFIFAADHIATRGLMSADGGFSTKDLIYAGGSIAAVGQISSGGNISAAGYVSGIAFVSTSDRNLKEDFSSVDSQEILERVASLPISSWRFKTDAAARHIGPMAQDFTAAFNVGEDDRHIATVDADGVALAAIQGLHALVLSKDAEIADLKKRLETLEKVVLKQHGGAQ